MFRCLGPPSELAIDNHRKKIAHMLLHPFQIFFKILYFLLKRINNRTRSWYARLVGVHVGQNCRLYSAEFGSEPYLVSIGDHVTVSGEAMFVTHDGGVWVFRDSDPTVDFIRPIVVEDNVFIGARAIILPGVVIESNNLSSELRRKHLHFGGRM
jgi:acetyltransferase-like isoleucine patch superfamily enzyme